MALKANRMKKLGLLFIISAFLWGCNGSAQKEETGGAKKEHEFTVQKKDAEWKEELSPEQYHILREAGTEPRHSSSLITVTDDGVMRCAACGNPLFKNEHKYTTTSSWPSFDRAIEGSVIYRKDNRLGYERTEVLCAECGSHLGHVFNDGPRETTGKRYCIDGTALDFVAKNEKNKTNTDKK